MNKKTFLLVGGRGSIGLATQQLLVREGHECILTSTKAIDGFVQLDLNERKSISTAATKVPAIDGLIICAGFEPQKSLREMTEAHMDKMFAIHVNGPLLLIQALQDKFRKAAAIIFISSVAAYKGSYDPTYATVKGAINAMTRTLARELSPDVRVNSIAPSLVADSPVYERMTPDFRAKHLNATLNKRLLRPEECAESIWFLLSNQHITGQIIHLNGGQYFGH